MAAIDTPDQVMVDFLRQVLRKEGVWIIEPSRYHNDSVVEHLVDRLRHVPCRIDNPPGTSQFTFAERSAKGRWLFVWVPTVD
jgi:hypothetical protein